MPYIVLIFFFQAEDGIRDRNVTGVQTCALPISITRLKQVCNHPAHYLGDGSPLLRDGAHRSGKLELVDDLLQTAFEEGQKALLRSEERRVGKECGARREREQTNRRLTT